MAWFGLLGQHLQHSYSPEIHGLLGDYEYRLCEVDEEDLERFLQLTTLTAMNVTIPYKKAVIPLCTGGLSDAARKIGSVNTLLRREGGWYGDNTDYYGFLYMVRASGIDVAGAKVLVLGDGGAAAAVRQGLRDLDAGEIITVSRRGPVTYDRLPEHRDAKVIVNTTPVGMYPDNGASPVELANFPALTGVLDIIYNPARTALLLEAEERGLKHAGGLEMLVAQAKRASELFHDALIDDSRVEEIVKTLRREKENLILIGMPACGKTTVGKLLAKALGRPFFDADHVLEQEAGCTIPEIFDRGGEEEFRRLETKTLSRLGKLSGAVIATGGGCVTRPENYNLLHQNGTIVWLRRDLSQLTADGRPLSQKHGVQELYNRRKALYEAFADMEIENNATPEQIAQSILEAMK